MFVEPGSSATTLIEQHHLLPFVLLFLFIGIVTTLELAVKLLFRCMAETVEAFYGFRSQCAAIKRRYAQLRYLPSNSVILNDVRHRLPDDPASSG